MVFGRMMNSRAREAPTIVEEVVEDDEAPACTFDDDADPSIERCWADGDADALMMMKNTTAEVGMIAGGDWSSQPLVLGAAGVAIVAVVAVLGLLLREVKLRKKAQANAPSPAAAASSNTTTTSSTKRDGGKTVAPPAKVQPPGGQQQQMAEPAVVESRVKELKLCLERETKEKQGLSEQNNFLKSALEERKATVQMFTSELQSRDEQLANFEQEQVKVKNELYNQIEALKNELQVQEKLQQQNLNNMDGQCADLAGKVEGLMKELANREEQWEKFEKDAKAKEVDSATQIEAIKKEFAAREQSQKVTLTTKDKECAELSAKLEALKKDMNSSEQQVKVFQQQRAKWGVATNEMKRLLKEKREEIVGLTTRMELFLGELQSREERVKSLGQKMADKSDLTSADLESLHKQLQAQKEDHEDWSAKTLEIGRLLGEREEESRELASKLEKITLELQSTSDKVVELEAKVQNKEFVIASNKEKLEKALVDEKGQRATWFDQHVKMSRLLKERQEECASLTARVEIFAAELKSREKIVQNLEVKVQDKANIVVGSLQALGREVQGAQAFRDTWSASTKGILAQLEERKEQVVGLSTRVDLFQLELKKREERVEKLESVLEGEENSTNATLAPYRSQLKAHQDDLSKWTDNTNEIRQLLKDRKNECVGLATRLSLFKKKVSEFEENVGVVSKKVDAKEGSYTSDLSPLREQLRQQQMEREKWNTQTIDIGKQLQDRQTQCVGLTTRCTLFKQQTKYHQDQVIALTAKVNELEERFALKLEPLRKELGVQRQGLDSWRESTRNVEELLKQAEQDCVDLTDELKVHVVKLQSCQKEVANLQAQVVAKSETVSSTENMYFAERKNEEAELEKWTNNTEDLVRLLNDKEGQIVGLNTRLALFETELSTRQSIVSDLTAKVSERGTAFKTQISSLQNELKFQREQRDHCLEATLHMNKSMKEVKEPCVGLTTRLALFRKELAGREERVRILDAQVRDKMEAERFEIDPMREELERLREGKDKWNDSTLDIFWMLKERQDQTVGLTTRLELFMSELQRKEDAVDEAESKLAETETGLVQIANMDNEIKVQEEQREKWRESTDEITRLLEQKEGERSADSISLSAKLELFKGELQRRESKVQELKATMQHRGERLRNDNAALEKQIPVLKDDRDSWMEKAMTINQTLKDTQNECTGLSTRWELFKVELKNRKEAVAELETKLHQKEEHHARMVRPYQNELTTQTGLRDKWVETIDKMERLLKKKESECVTFTTQLETSIDELSGRKEQVARLEKSLGLAVERAQIEMGNLKSQLTTATESFTSWDASTKNVAKMLKDKRQECENLKVRLQVFRRQVETQDRRLAMLESAYKAKSDDVNAQMEALQNQLRSQQSARDQTVSSTLSINQQIKDKEMQCTSISVRLSLFRTELENREKCVATLEEKLKETEDLSTLQIDPVKAQLQQQTDELAKWIVNTKDVHALLKKRDEERVGLATRLKLFQLQLKGIEESVAILGERVKEREEAASSEMAPFKNALQAQQAERDRWTASTLEIVNLLQDRKTQITGLTVRLSLFRKEVKHREHVVARLESQLEEKESEVNDFKLDPIKKQLAALTAERDQWAAMTENLTKTRKSKQAEISGLTTRLACFKMELQKREEACNVLLKKYNDQKSLSGSQVQVLKSELAMQMEQRDKWRETTTEMRKQLVDREAQAVGLNTRVELFLKEIEGHDATIESLKQKLKENSAAIDEVKELKKELQVQQEHRDTLSKSMEETGQLLKEKKAQCAGLATRLVVFRQQLKERMERLNKTATTIKEKEELTNAQIESLKIDLQSQKEQRDKWSETTEELKKLLEEKEKQCSIISAELELLTNLQGAAS
ncbi:Inherit from NOG: Viral A-type inclusion protein [Seminavis robusta]|uniref:Inherit from NOG: Viral A-type inclusion protein n=1 Tax=Seminavis robusta TaxID=568900 RepID=A0A9N8HD71_9STRA|nr:Inherit from NOG: Viral A-type inclusion protein [Seminavis robusta]|eukprot:Sro348_g123240.1 Inherit from NOG: Viral A-type inclusion protein (1866) ;mRNA; f:41022-47001